MSRHFPLVTARIARGRFGADRQSSSDRNRCEIKAQLGGWLVASFCSEFENGLRSLARRLTGLAKLDVASSIVCALTLALVSFLVLAALAGRCSGAHHRLLRCYSTR
jgi:hypothetical protein